MLPINPCVLDCSEALVCSGVLTSLFFSVTFWSLATVAFVLAVLAAAVSLLSFWDVF